MKTQPKKRRMVNEKALPKLVTHRPPKKPPRVGEGGKWKPRVGF